MTNPFPDFLSRVRRWLPSPSRFEQRLEGVSSPGKKWGAAEWVISRAFCRFGRFDLGHIPAPQRTNALRLQISEWTPFAQTGSCLVLLEDQALVWIWDQAQIDAAIAEADLGRRRISLLPETLLHPAMQEGQRLVACLDGCEAQVWRQGRLAASRWWPDDPGPQGWAAFLRDSGLPAAAKPEMERIALTEHPWGSTAALQESFRWQNEPLFVMGGFFVLASVTLWSAGEWMHYANAIETQKARLETLEKAAGPIQEARQQALQSKEGIDFLATLDPYPPLPILLAEVGKNLPRDGTFVKEWDYQKGQLRLSLGTAGKLQTTAFVKIFQDTGWFADVQARTGNDAASLTLEMRVLEIREISPDLLAGGMPKTGQTPPASPSSPAQS